MYGGLYVEQKHKSISLQDKRFVIQKKAFMVNIFVRDGKTNWVGCKKENKNTFFFSIDCIIYLLFYNKFAAKQIILFYCNLYKIILVILALTFPN